MKIKREYIAVPVLIVLGALFGVLAKAGDTAVQGSAAGNLLRSFGTVSTGMFIWAAVCTVIAASSKNKIQAGANVFLFLSAMIAAYYLYSHFVTDYLALREVKFWLLMLMPSAVLGFAVWHIQTSRLLKYTVSVLGTAVMIYDMYNLLLGSLPEAKIMLAVLYAVFLAFMRPKRGSRT